MYSWPFSIGNTICAVIFGWTLYFGSKQFRLWRIRRSGTRLGGPTTWNFLTGFLLGLIDDYTGAVNEERAKKYGLVYKVPLGLGVEIIDIHDPVAVAHTQAREGQNYGYSKSNKKGLEKLIGKSLLWAEGDLHKKQRKIMSPAFNTSAIRSFSQTFFDSGHKCKAAWDAIIQKAGSGDEAVIDVEEWMYATSIDSLGIAGFSHDFESLRGKKSVLAETFESLADFKPDPLLLFLIILSVLIPPLRDFPTERTRGIQRICDILGKIGEKLLQQSRGQGASKEREADRSIIGMLLRAEESSSFSDGDAQEQMKLLILAGYETTALNMTWTLWDLATNPEKQSKLREELNQLGQEPTFEQLNGDALPYLDAVVKEALRLHPPLPNLGRQCKVEDVVPLSEPLKLPDGKVVDHIVIPVGANINIPVAAINRSERFWGPDAKEFKPERWIEKDGIPQSGLDLQGWNHIFSFSNGPRLCLGRNFAIAEIKAVLSVLVRNFAFEPRDGADSKIDKYTSLFTRPKLAGETKAALPLRVRRLT
ncbi:cytochrome P450 [Sistotremastrum niveocremeum HHB9708]|uniref:Cytochrome P450 n=1 Tax=Sistotremastrum niveocremeum HHB9708 TaxID=1314777 RepID=A0A164VHJ8_9AGAM|nr:cytochrome P450 [Sistotremastrum niveocremeum HHB9708]